MKASIGSPPGNAVVVGGVGDTLGKAIARRFAREGLVAALVARNRERLERTAEEIRAEGGRAECFPADLSKESDVIALFERVATRFDAIEAAIYVAATRVRGPITQTSAEDFEKAWRFNCFTGFLFAREAARRMLVQRRGTLVFTGAAGSFKGRAELGAFDAAKGALRHLAQSMARELWAQGVHVATVMIEGAIASERMQRDEPARMARLGADGALAPDDIAHAYWHLHCQEKSAWSLEVDLRPWSENF